MLRKISLMLLALLLLYLMQIPAFAEEYPNLVSYKILTSYSLEFNYTPESRILEAKKNGQSIWKRATSYIDLLHCPDGKYLIGIDIPETYGVDIFDALTGHLLVSGIRFRPVGDYRYGISVGGYVTLEFIWFTEDYKYQKRVVICWGPSGELYRLESEFDEFASLLDLQVPILPEEPMFKLGDKVYYVKSNKVVDAIQGSITPWGKSILSETLSSLKFQNLETGATWSKRWEIGVLRDTIVSESNSLFAIVDFGCNQTLYQFAPDGTILQARLLPITKTYKTSGTSFQLKLPAHFEVEKFFWGSIGNKLVFTPESCYSDDPRLHYETLMWDVVTDNLYTITEGLSPISYSKKDWAGEKIVSVSLEQYFASASYSEALLVSTEPPVAKERSHLQVKVDQPNFLFIRSYLVDFGSVKFGPIIGSPIVLRGTLTSSGEVGLARQQLNITVSVTTPFKDYSYKPTSITDINGKFTINLNEIIPDQVFLEVVSIKVRTTWTGDEQYYGTEDLQTIKLDHSGPVIRTFTLTFLLLILLLVIGVVIYKKRKKKY